MDEIIPHQKKRRKKTRKEYVEQIKEEKRLTSKYTHLIHETRDKNGEDEI